ncbi:MAG: MbnP family protein, partial [Bacteroidota bacterium]
PFRYDSIYPSPFDTNHLFSIRRIRFFLSKIEIIRQGGEQVTVQDSIELEAPAGVSRKVLNSFAKLDRDIFQANVLGTVVAKGVFDSVKFRFGLDEILLQTDPASTPAGHLLAAGDTILYDSTAGFASAVLIFKTDTLSATPPLEFRLTESQEITLPLEMPVNVEEGFDLKITLRLNYLALFDGVDLQHESVASIRQKIVQNLPKLFFGAVLEVD